MTGKDDDDDHRSGPVGVLDERSLEDSLERQLASDEEEREEPSDPGAPRPPLVADEEDAAAGKPFERDRTRPAPTVPVFPLDDEAGTGGASQESAAPRTSLFGMLAAGARALRRFPLLVASMYLAQVALSAGAALVIGALLFDAFGLRPLFDRAMTGDAGALARCFLVDRTLLHAMLAIGAAAMATYAVLSWFMTAGLIAVLLDPPERRREVARWFGAGGAANFYPFVRLALWSALAYVPLGLAVASGALYLSYAALSIVTTGELLGVMARLFALPLVVHWVLGTAIDFARIDLVRHPGLSALRALLRGLQLVGRRPVVLLHSLGYGVLFVIATAGYAAVAAGPAATAGLGALIALRQLCAAVRFGAHVGLVAGQVELSCSCVHSPRRRFVP
jgi:hypothetical protein